MKVDLAHVLEISVQRAFNGAQVLATALLVGFSNIAVAAQTYNIANLSLGGTYGQARSFNASGQVTGWLSTTGGDAVHAFFASPETGTIDIGTVGGTASFAQRINASGQIVGYSFAAGDATLHAFSWTRAGGMVDLGALTPGYYSLSTGVNDSGQVVGFWQPADYKTSHGFLWSQTGGMTDLGTLGGTWTAAASISNSGQVLGISNLVPGDLYNYHAFLWTAAGGMVDLGTLGGTSSSPLAINTLGQVVGGSNLADNTTHPFLWTSAGGMVDLGANGGTDAFAFAITSSGQVLGLSYSYRPSVTRVFSWTAAGGMVDIGSLGGDSTVPAAFDPSGQVVGGSQRADASYHAFSWTSAGGLIDLGTLGGSYSSAKGVNALGQVVGYSMTAGDASQHAFIYDGASLKDLNDLVPNKPAGMELLDAYFLSDSKTMVAATNVGLVLLSPTSTGPVAPVVGPITANDPVAVGATLSVSANFTDANATDSHTASWTFGDGSAAQSGTVTESNGSGTAKGSHTFAAAGVYPVSVAVTDNGGLVGNGAHNVVVYDPSAGFVTGNGSIRSPLGAFKADPTVAGMATFSFVSKYQKGAKVPVGTTAFQFQSANLDFYSDSYDWMVVAGARAQFKGTGSLNSTADYKFLLTAIDGQVTGGGGTDRFRVKIWHYDAALRQDVVDYDNQLDASTEGTLSEGTAIANGSIVIHTPNK